MRENKQNDAYDFLWSFPNYGHFLDKKLIKGKKI